MSHAALPHLVLHVSPTGNDHWSGRLAAATAGGDDGPLASLAGAQTVWRLWRRGPGGQHGQVTVQVQAGDYELRQPLVLSAEDSGSASAPLVISGPAGDGARARLLGGPAITNWAPVSEPAVRARLAPAVVNQVRVADLSALGIQDCGQFQPRGHGRAAAPSHLEVFVNEQALTLARWPAPAPLPNHGFALIAEAVGQDGFTVREPLPGPWATPADAVACGYWANDWGYSTCRVAGVDRERGLIRTEAPHGIYGYRPNGRFFIANLLEELRGPGQYYLDRAAGRVYCLPPADAKSDTEYRVSVLSEPLVTLSGCHFVQLQWLAFHAGRGTGLSLHDCHDGLVAGCRFQGLGGNGIEIHGGLRLRVQSCDLAWLGDCGIWLAAGDRTSLTPCEHVLSNNHIHHVARWSRSYHAAIMLVNSCGVQVLGNRLNDHYHTAVWFKVNDCLFERNEVYNVCLECDDNGAFYTGRDFSFQGNVLRHNYLHHIGESGRNTWGSSGFYHDDGAGGSLIEGNIVCQARKGVLAGGGLNTQVRHNLFVECEPAIWVDERCFSEPPSDTGMVHGYMKQQFYAVKADQPLYQQRYPNMDYVKTAFERREGLRAIGNEAVGNYFHDCPEPTLKTAWTGLPDWFRFAPLDFSGDPGFTAAEFGIYDLPDGSPLRAAGLPAPPFRAIGLQRDAFRPRLTSVYSRLVIERPLGREGTPARLHLDLRNEGDLEVAGVELLELRLHPFGLSLQQVSLPFRVAPGEQTRVSFELALHAALPPATQELYLATRGELVRPVWGKLPIAGRLQGTLSASGAVPGTPAQPSATLRLTLRHAGDAPLSEVLSWQVTPPEYHALEGAPGSLPALAPGAEHQWPITLRCRQVPPHGLLPKVSVTVSGKALAPLTLALEPRYPLPTLPAGTALRVLADLLAEFPGYHLGAGRVPLATVRLARCGGALALLAQVRDSATELGRLIWDGSCVEVFGAMPDQRRIGAVFGNLRIGQVLLQPGIGIQEARAWHQQGENAVADPGIALDSWEQRTGYTMIALIPWERLQLQAEAQSCLLEVAITIRDPNGACRRAKLGGSATPFNDSSCFLHFEAQPGAE